MGSYTKKDGVTCIKLKSWNNFHDLIKSNFLELEEYVWRGQRHNWRLESKLDRILRQIPKSPQINLRKKHYTKFKYAIRGRLSQYPKSPKGEDDNEQKKNDLWAIGQHHGLATPLLDWTTSPYFAQYFAFIKEENEQSTGLKENEIRRSVYALQESYVKTKSEELEQKNQKIPSRDSIAIKFFRPMSNENPRLVNQAGLFTRAPDRVSIEHWVEQNYQGKDESILVKIYEGIDHLKDSYDRRKKEREKILTYLNRMNINHLTLFPDLYGASEFCNLALAIKNYHSI